jgi:hypothetical protein
VKDQLREFIRCQRHCSYFVANYCVIRHPQRGAIRFDLWPWQVDVLHAFQRDPRIIILKSRQLGVSELGVAYALWQARFTPGWLGLFVSKRQDDASDLLQRLCFMLDHLPDFLAPGHALDGCMVAKRNSRVLELLHTLSGGFVSSRIDSLPATRGTGRGKPASWVFLVERAHQPYQAEIKAALAPTLATGGSLVEVSSANGMGNDFHHTWVNAERGENGYRAIFLPWSLHPERNAAWYAAQCTSMEAWQVAQEYPSNAGEAFVQSGRPVFGGYLVEHEARVLAAAGPLEDADGLTVWCEATVDQRYRIGADVAEGLADGDYDAACVFDETGYQVAALHGRWPPDVFAVKLYQLGERYGFPLLAVERNNHGHACLLRLRDLEYPNLYYPSDPLKLGAHDDLRPGFVTTASSKPLIIDLLAKGLREQACRPRDRLLLREMSVFAYRVDGGMGAPDGFHDDRVMACAIAWYLVSQPDGVAHAETFFAELAASVGKGYGDIGGRT